MGPASLIKLDSALQGVTKLGFATPPFIYFIKRHASYVDILREVFRRVDMGAIVGYSSAVTLTEVLTRPKQTGDTALQQSYRQLLTASRNFTLVAIDAAVAEVAAELRAQYRPRTPDALQIAAAAHSGCEAFLTNDAALLRVATLRFLILDQLER